MCFKCNTELVPTNMETMPKRKESASTPINGLTGVGAIDAYASKIHHKLTPR